MKSKIDYEISNIADCSLLAFLSIIIKINRDLRILSYRSNSQILEQIKNYKVTMGFGLHMGWGIEGAIGSNYKIDASYLSPNVNMAARLEAATRQYGVKILISGQIYELITEELKDYCRIIDIVTVKGSLEPIKLYTVDLNEEALKPYKKDRKDFSDKTKREKQILIKNSMKASLEDSTLTKLLLKKKQFKRLLNDARPIEFYVAFNSAFKYYVEGEWKKAKAFFLKCMLIYEHDGPVNTLYDFIKSFEFVSPNDWRGYRSLTSK